MDVKKSQINAIGISNIINIRLGIGTSKSL